VHGLGTAPTKADVNESDTGARTLRIDLATRKGALPGFIGALVLRAEPWNA
jgi:hypothetical protein